MKTKEFILSFIFIVITLIIYGLFPVKNPFQQFIVMATFFVIIPIIFNKFILKRGLNSFKIEVGDWKLGLFFGGICIIIIGAIFLLAEYFFSFIKNYPIPSFIIGNYQNFLFYEFILVAPVIFIYEFFFRGFVGFILENKIGYWSIMGQALLFLILALITKGVDLTLVPYLIGAPLAGLIVYKSRSIFYSTIFQFIVIVVIDASVIYIIK